MAEATEASAHAPKDRRIPCVDSGVLIKLYVLERNSDAAARMVASFSSVKLYPFGCGSFRTTIKVMVGKELRNLFRP